MTHCPVAGMDCPDMDNCTGCLEWLASCDRCHVGGHTDAGSWKGYLVGPGEIRCLCEGCYEIEGGAEKEEEQELIWGEKPLFVKFEEGQGNGRHQ
jgi:hypothetical protein